MGHGDVAGYLAVTMPGRPVTWLAEEGRNTVLGYGRLLMIDGLGVLELYVVPEARRSGIGEQLLQVMAQRAVAEGFTDLGVEVMVGTPATTFYAKHGFTHAYTEMRSILGLATVDWGHIEQMATGVAHGYRIEYYPHDLPDEVLPGYALAKQVRRSDPTGDLELRPSPTTPSDCAPAFNADRRGLRLCGGRGARA
jgi:hypothetical protein